MDTNLVVLSGRLAAPVEKRLLPGGLLIRLLVTVRDEVFSRVDVVPVSFMVDLNLLETGVEVESLHVPGGDLLNATPGSVVWVVGAIQRRFWQTEAERRSTPEVIAERVHLREATPDEIAQVLALRSTEGVTHANLS